VFALVRQWRNGESAFLYAFELIELNGDDLRREPLERRKAAFESCLRGRYVSNRSRLFVILSGKD
jgi:ATP-dependent DNA ligase